MLVAGNPISRHSTVQAILRTVLPTVLRIGDAGRPGHTMRYVTSLGARAHFVACVSLARCPVRRGRVSILCWLARALGDVVFAVGATFRLHPDRTSHLAPVWETSAGAWYSSSAIVRDLWMLAS